MHTRFETEENVRGDVYLLVFTTQETLRRRGVTFQGMLTSGVIDPSILIPRQTETQEGLGS